MSTVLSSPILPQEPLIKPQIISRLDDESIPSCYSNYKYDEVNVSPVLASKWSEWSPETPVFICADTGSGKTSFILELALQLRESGKEGLIVSNRLALREQGKRRYIKMTDSKLNKTHTDFGLQQEEWIENLRFVTYQGLSKIFCEPDKDRYSFVFLDEIHCLASDAFFMRGTGWLLEKIPIVFSRAIRIYASATPWVIFYPLAEAECVIYCP